MQTKIAGNSRPVINFSEPVSGAACIDLIDRIRALRDDLFFAEVQLRLSSPGGEVSALEYFVEAARDIRSGGFRIDTHAVTRVSSAAAVMLSLGDIRTAHPKAALLYHTGRVAGVRGAVTATQAASIADALNNVDDEIIGLLAERVADSSSPAGTTPSERFSPADWQVIGRLSPANARRPDTALRRFRKRVVEAFDGGQEKLRALYADFCALDAPVSPWLALELGLIDSVGDGEPEVGERAADPGLNIPQWDRLYPGGQVPRHALTRHALILGESGSGKTVSGILPVVSAIVQDEAPVSCALVIDPKFELYLAIRSMAGPGVRVRLLHADKDSLNLMTGPHSIADDVAAGSWMSAARKILARASGFSASPARILAGKPPASPRNAFWEMEGSRLAQAVLAFTLLISHEGRVEGLLAKGDRLLMVGICPKRLARFARFAGLSPDADGPSVNALAAAKCVLDDFFSEPRRAANIINVLNKDGIADADSDAIRREIIYWDNMSKAENHFAGAIAEARTCFYAFSDPAPAKALMFGVEGAPATVDFSRDMGDSPARDGGRTIYVLQPGDSDGNSLIAKSIKAAFFEAVLASPSRREHGGEMPLVGYIADEFHRFATTDESHGEQNFLDRCRSFGTACVLATQSDASIAHALELAGEPSPGTAIRLLLTNTATKLAFRSTEAGVHHLIDGICPGSGPHRVTALRPPSTLRPGECYASLPDGRFERRQLKPLDLSREAR